MKITVLILVGFFQVSAGTMAQNISLSEKSVSLVIIFESINRQTGYEFLYDADVLAKANPVDINVTGATLEEVLIICFKQQPLTYVISEKTIVVKSLPDAPKIIEPERTRITITGTVTDESGGIMPGVSVIVKGTTIGTATNETGSYTIDLDSKTMNGDEVLVFTFVGYKPLEEKIINRSVIDVMMQEDPTMLNAVQIIGTNYFTVTKERSTMNIAKVEAKEIEKQPVTNPLMALQGRMAGVDITPYNGVPGAAIKIQVRGNNSLRPSGSYLLYVIDGVPVESSALQSDSQSTFARGIDPLSTLDATNIESIEVLKDGASTAIYGSRGANGVVRITTKKGRAATKTSLDISLYTGFGEMTKEIDLLNTKQYMRMKHESYANDGIIVPGPYDFVMNGVWDSTRYTNWQEVLLGGTSRVNSLSGSLAGGNGKTSFRVGGSYRTESAIYPGESGFRNLTGNLSVDHVSTNQKLKMNFSVSYGANTNKTYSDLNFLNYALRLAPNAPALYDENGALNWQETYAINPERLVKSWDNPMSLLLRTHQINVQNLITNGVLSYEILPGFSVKSNLGFTSTVGNELLKSPIASQAPSDITAQSTASLTAGSNTRSSWIIEPQLAYARNIQDHALDILVGGSWQESRISYQSITGTGYTSDALLNSFKGATTLTFNTDQQGHYRYCAFFGRLGYSWKDKYLLDITGRRDGSSRFGPGNKFANFWGIGAGWIFSKESVFNGENDERSRSYMSFGKIRGSYAITGNDQIGDYKYLNTYDISGTYQNQVTFYPTGLFNPGFAWEETRKLEFALELGFLQDRLMVEPSWYRNVSSNQLIDYPLPGTTGFSTILSNFDAVIENTGWEFMLNSSNIAGSALRWNTSVTLSFPRNKLLKFDNLEDSPYADDFKVGEPVTMRRFYHWLGVNPLTGLHEVQDVNGDGVYNTSDEFRKWVGRRYYGGVTNSFVYKSVELSFLVYFAAQTSALFVGYIPGGSTNQPVEVLGRWQKKGDITNYQKFSTSPEASSAYANAIQSDYTIKNSSFIRLKTVSLSYALPVSKIGLQSAKVFVQASNLLTITKLKAFDPETGTMMPPLRIVTLGIDLKL